MTTYGADYYGAPSSLYGDQGQINYNASPFLARSWYANLVELTWALPTGDWTRLRLVRSSKGAPMHEDSGSVLFDVSCGPSAVSPNVGFTYWADRSVPGDRWYQYGLFVYAVAVTSTDTITDNVQDSFGTTAIDDWVFAGFVDVLVVNDHHNTKYMADRLPSVYTTDPREAGAGQADAGSDMSRFLGLFGYQADVVRGTYESLLHLHNPDLVPARVLPLLCSELGVPYEPQLGMDNVRVLLRNAVRIHKTKGTKVGIENFATSLTGWACSLDHGVNLMLDYNDSSAEEGVGSWYPRTNCTVTQAPITTVVPYAAAHNRTNGSFAVTSTVAGLCEMRCGDSHIGEPLLKGVPVKGGFTYTITTFIKASTATAANRVGFTWHDSSGAIISAVNVGASFTSTALGWTRASYTGAAPALAVFAVPVFQVTATAANQVHYVDAFQVENASEAHEFQEARQLQLMLASDRTNQILNPSFEVDTQFWVNTASGTAALATSITVINGDSASIAGSSCAQVVAPGTVINEGITTVLSGLVPNQDYTLSAYVKAVSGRPIILRAQATGGAVVSTLSAAVGTGWTRLNCVVTTGLSATVSVSITTDSITPGASTFRVDGVLLERTLQLRDYFDASTVGVHASDYQWGGTPHASASHQYRDFVTKSLRLSELLPDYMWPGMTFQLLVGDVDTTGSGSSGFGAYPYGAGFFGGSTAVAVIPYGDGDYGVGDYE